MIPAITNSLGCFINRPAIESRMEVMIAGHPKQIMAIASIVFLSCQQASGSVVMFFDQLMFIHRHQLPFFDDELAADNCVIHADGLPEDNCRKGIMHACEFQAIQINREEISTLSTFQTSNIISSNHCRAAARAEI